MRKKRYTKEQLTQAVASSVSIREVATKLSLPINGDTYRWFYKDCDAWGISHAHFLGQSACKNKVSPLKKPIETYLVFSDANKRVSNGTLRNRLLEEGLKEYRCEKCQNETWLNSPIPLELHHKDGCSWNNQIENLEFLCPNCHAQTDNYKGRNKNHGGVSQLVEESASNTDK